jgi:hypothetical protein
VPAQLAIFVTTDGSNYFSTTPLATVARTGAYADLSGTPTLGGAAALNVGTTTGTVAAGDDSRMTNARTPTAHASTHVTGGSDVIANAVAAGNAGLMSGTDKSKLDGIAAGATAFNPAVPGAIGGTTPAAGTFTTVTATEIITNAEYDNGTCTTSKTITPVNGNRQKVTLTNGQTCALSFTQPSSGTVSVQLKVIQSTTSSYNGAISGCKWPSGTTPTITQTTGAIDVVSAYLDGTNAYCVATQDFR